MKKAGFALIIFLMGFLISTYAFAVSFDLNTFFGFDGDNLASGNFGTVTITDSGDYVDLTVDLADDNWKVLSLYLNYNDDVFPVTGMYNWIMPGGNSNLHTISPSENGKKADGYSGLFDIHITGMESENLDYYYTQIAYEDVMSGPTVRYDLSDMDFYFKDFGTDTLYLAVHIGSYGESGEDSLWAASRDIPVPIPATILLLGSGLAGLFGFRRKLRKRQ